MRNIILVVFLFAVWTLCLQAQTGRYVPELARLDARMADMLSKYGVSGGQLALTYRGRLVYSRGFGFADTTSKSLVQPNSIFRQASVSKAITSVALMHLVEQGRLKLDALVFGKGGLLDTNIYRGAKDLRMYNITVRQLLSHSAGFEFVFPSDPIFQTYQIAIDAGITPPTNSPEVIITWALKNVTLKNTPGTAASYSNFAYVVLGKVIESVTGIEYEKFVRDSILAPMYITDVHAGKSLAKDRFPNEVSYYDYPGAPLSTSIYTGTPNSVPAQYGGYNWEVMTPAGGWVASAQDLCRLLVSVDGYNTKPDFLKQSTIDTMTRSSQNWPAYGLGWFVGGDDYWHTGGIQGTASVIQCNAEHQLTWAIVFNQLPQNYTPLYNEFMAMVLNEVPNVSQWPTHDLWDVPSAVHAVAAGKAPSKITISPNPTHREFVLRAESFFERVEIYNSLGMLVSRIDCANNSREMLVNLGECAPGLYYVSAVQNQFENFSPVFTRVILY